MAAETIKKRTPVFVKVNSLRPDTTGHNLKVKVVDAKLVLNRPGNKTLGNTPSRVAECTVGDETGVIVLTARNEQVDVAKPGSSIIIRNAKIDMFRQSMRLAVNQWGKLEESKEGFSFSPLTDHNLSLVEYELVPVSVAESSSNAAAEGSSGGNAAAAQDGIAAS